MEKYTTPEQCQDLEDICTLLQDKGSKQFSRKYSSLPPIIKWFDVLEDSLVVDDPFKTNFKTDHYNMLVPNILRLLRFCFLTRKDVPTVTLLSLLTDEPQKHIDVIWKGVLEVAYHNPDRYKPFFFQLVNQLKSLYEVNAKEILLEYLLFVLHQGDINEAKHVFTVHAISKKNHAVTEQTKNVDILCKAYQGLVYYVEWILAKSRHKKFQDLGKQLDTETSENFEQLMLACADKALNNFEVLKEVSGVWDIFITKHLEILEHYDKLEEAEALLRSYKDKNEDNPNAHKFLYSFAVRQEWQKPARIDLLKGLAKHVPSDPLVIELCELLIQENDGQNAIPFLFALLDDGMWQFELRPWKLMSELLISEVKGVNVMKGCMTFRTSWWPQYHFSSTYNCSSQLSFHKAVCCLLMDPSNTAFPEQVMMTLSPEEKEQFLSLTKRLKDLSKGS